MVNKKITVTIVSIFFGIIFAIPTFATVVEVPFGGIRIAPTITCTCGSPARFLVTVYDYTSNRPLLLSYVPGASILYSSFNVYSSLYLLGTYNPVATNMCWIVVSGSCVVIPDNGMLGTMPGTGFSL